MNMAESMQDAEVDRSLKGLDGWTHDDVYKRIQKEYHFSNFDSAVTFVQHVASIANDISHYPDILIHSGNSVRISATSTADGGVTEKDIALAESLEILVNS